MPQKSTFTHRNAAIFAVISALVGYMGYSYISNAAVEKQLQQAANEINKTCPLVVDKDTRLDTVFSSSSKSFHYTYTLPHYIKNETDTAVLARALKPQLIDALNTTLALRFFRQHRVTLVYHYKDKDGLFLLSIPITPEEYQK